jgi:predicted heme/steroid binding protein
VPTRTVILTLALAATRLHPGCQPQVEYIAVMAERTISQAELRRCNGERGAPVYVAYEGVVYDLSNCPKWRTGLHEGLHFAGFDLTSEMPFAPHAAEVFRLPCVRRVGRLIQE